MMKVIKRFLCVIWVIVGLPIFILELFFMLFYWVVIGENDKEKEPYYVQLISYLCES
jgi:hypothetical protein